MPDNIAQSEGGESAPDGGSGMPSLILRTAAVTAVIFIAVLALLASFVSAVAPRAFMELYRGKTEQDHAREYRDRSLVLGKDIQVLLPEGSRKAKAVDIDQDCRLEVEYEDGSREKLAAGEIRILI